MIGGASALTRACRLNPRVAALFAIAMLACACTRADDNATRLARRVTDAAAQLKRNGTGAVATVDYEPVATSAAPYTLVLCPDWQIGESDLVAAGMPADEAHRVLSQVAFLGDTAHLLIVDQGGQRLTFTTYWRRAAAVRELLVSRRKTGTSRIELRNDDGTIHVVGIS